MKTFFISLIFVFGLISTPIYSSTEESSSSARTPENCQELAKVVYSIASVRDSGRTLAEVSFFVIQTPEFQEFTADEQATYLEIIQAVFENPLGAVDLANRWYAMCLDGIEA